MDRIGLCSVTVLVTLGAGAGAQAATVRLDQPQPARPVVVEPTASPALSGVAKSVAPGSLLALPWFEVDTTSGSGRTTLFAIRNEAAVATTAQVTYFSADGVQSLVENLALGPKQTRTRNLRDVVVGQLAADLDGVIRGWARIQTSGGATLSHDVFYVDPAGNFAGGEVLVNPNDGDVCEHMRGRFLIGGAFSGGTRLLVFVDLPLGNDPVSDPPTLTGTAYSESGVLLNTFSVWTDKYAFELDAVDLVDGATAFGSLELTFENAGIGLLGGTAVFQASAEGRYAVTWRGTCMP
jgi:hypothetical protein